MYRAHFDDIARRIGRAIRVALIASTLAWPALAAAQDSPVIKINAEAARSDIKITPLRGGVSMLEGSGGNIGVLVAPGEKFMVDAGIAISKDKLAKALASLSADRVTNVVNTHWHWDHTDGNAWLHDAGAEIVAHPRTAQYVAQVERVDDWSYTFQPLAPSGQPRVLVKDRKQYAVGGEQVDVVAIPPAHTDGDLYVYFKNADVLFVGDTYWNGIYPFIDNEHGGSIDGMIRAADLSLKMAGPRTIVIPGHGPPATRADLEEYRTMLQTIRDNVAKLKKQGKDRDAVIAAKPSSQFDAKWGQFLIDPAFFTRLVYDGL
jgi:glyoxylase-like metal-dependent hydrolase (beta-lactamase superfamily II)